MKNIEIFISARGTKGDIYPLVGVAEELRKRNFNVVFQANDVFKELIENHNIAFISGGTSAEYYITNEDPDMWSPDGDMLAADLKGGILNQIESEFNYVAEAHRTQRKIFVVSIGSLSGARLAATKFSIPQAVFLLQPSNIVSSIAPSAPLCWAIPAWIPNKIYFFINRIIGAIYGRFSPPAPPEGVLKIFDLFKKLDVYDSEMNMKANYPQADLLLGFFPAWFGMPAKDWPEKIKLVGFPFSEVSNKPIPQNVDAFIKEKGAPIVFTSGTGVHDKTEIFRDGRRICELLGMPGLFVGGAVGKELLDGQSLCLHVDYVDFDHVLPKCNAIVHHGGVGTAAQAIRSGIPQLIRPLKIDQPDNANRIKKLGLGEFFLPGTFNVERAAELLKVMIDQKSSNRSLQLYSEELKKSNAIENACDLIEQKISTFQ